MVSNGEPNDPSLAAWLREKDNFSSNVGAMDGRNSCAVLGLTVKALNKIEKLRSEDTINEHC